MIVKHNEGYGILWKKRVGPVVAHTVEAAVTIANYAHTMGAKHMDVPLRNVPEKFLSQLKGRGVDYATPATRMVRGSSAGDTAKVFASFSSALG